MEKLKKYNKDGDEITRYGFVSNMEAFIEKLMSGNITAKTSDYLQSHGITTDIALKELLAKKDKSDPTSSIISRKESIKTDKESGKDKFHIKYTVNNKNKIEGDLRNLYIKLFEWHEAKNPILTEDGEGGGFSAGANSCGSVGGAYDVPLFGRANVITPGFVYKPKMKHKSRKKVMFNESQIKLIREAMCTFNAGSYTYDAPAFIDKETADRKGIFAKGFKKNRK